MSRSTITNCDHCGECDKGSGLEFVRLAITRYGEVGPDGASVWVDLCQDCNEDVKKFFPRVFEHETKPLRYSDGFGGTVER